MKSWSRSQRGEALVERSRNLRNLRELLGREVVEVFVDRRRWLDAVLDAVESGHQHRGEREVRVARWVGATELEPLRLRALRVQRDAHRRGAVSLRVHEVHRCLVTGDEPLVGVRRWVRERADRRRVREQSADVPARHVGEPRVTGFVEEQRLAALPQRLVHVHARAVVHEDRLRHEGDRVSALSRHVLHDVLVEHELVGHRRDGVEAHVDLGLPRSADFVVLHLDRDADLLEHAHHLGTQVLELVHRRDREVALLVPRLVPEVGAAVELALAPRVPHAFDGVDEVVARELVLIEAHRVEDVELGLGAEVRGVGETGARRGTRPPSARCSAGRACTTRPSTDRARSS